MRGIERMSDVLRLNVKAIDIVQPAVPGFGHDRQTPPVAGFISGPVFDPPRDDRVARDADAVRVSDDDRSFKKTALFDPGYAGHFAVAI